MKAHAQTLAVVADRDNKQGTVHVAFPNAETLENWHRMTTAEKVLSRWSDSDQHTVDLHPSPAAYLESLEDLPEQEQKAGREGLAHGIVAELTGIERDRINGQLKTSEANQAVDNLIDRIGGPDLAKVPLKVAARDSVNGQDVAIFKEVSAYVAKLTPENTNNLVDERAKEPLALKEALERLDALRADYQKLEVTDKGTQAVQDERELIDDRAEEIAASFQGPDVSRIPLQQIALDYIHGDASRTDLELAAINNATAAEHMPKAELEASHQSGHDLAHER